jgi:class 3 adenylate cyclase
MIKKPWFISLVFGLIGFVLSVYFSLHEKKLAFIISAVLTIALLFLTISFRAIQSNETAHKKLRRIFMLISLCLLASGLLSKYVGVKGANAELIFGVLSYCFIYAPFELFLKHKKWQLYSNNKWEMFLLSSLDFIGVNLVLLGILSINLDWPGQYFLIYPGCAILIIGLISWNTRFKEEVVRRKSSEDKIKTQYLEIEKEKQRSESLLLNILPAEVAEELKSKGSADAKQFDEVTVLFTDFKNFTKLAQQMTATELVQEIHACFMAFDGIMEKYGIEKIKTIGDSYMCAGGLPVANKTHAVDVVSAGLDIQQFISNRMSERITAGKEPFQIRIGIHTGPVVAGIVGIKKYAYDIWGDTVNTASRMESSGEAGHVNISGSTYALVKDQFNCKHRGKIQAKGKGELDMYFAEKRI